MRPIGGTVGPRGSLLVGVVVLILAAGPARAGGFVASFDAQPIPGSDPPEVTFVDTSSGGTATAWHWDFGDGSSSTGASATHTYAWPGAYEVTLTVSEGATPHVASDVVVAKAVFSAAAVHTPGKADDLFAEDVDGDGDVDLMAISSSTLRVFENDGLGGFSLRSLLVDFSIVRAFAADVDSDGDPDIVVARGGPSLDWYENTAGLQTLGAMQPIGSTGANVYDVVDADLDGDGDLDLLCGLDTTTTTEEPTLVWFEAAGAGSFVEHVLLDKTGIAHVAAVDLDADGDLDVIGYADGEAHVRWYLNDGGGTFTPGGLQSWGTPFSSPGYLRTADVDGDGDTDVVLTTGGACHVAENTGAGLGPLAVVASKATTYRGLGTGDFDGDGDVDIVTMSRFDTFGNGFLRWFENLGGGAYLEVPIGPGTLTQTRALATFDVEGDGDLDLVVARGDSPFSLDLAENRHQWTSLGGGSASVATPPRLTGNGALATGSPTRIDLTGAPGGAPSLLWLSFTSAPLEVLGGTLHAFPKTSQVLAFADGGGGWSQTIPWPSVAAGIDLWLQAIVQDVSAPAGLTLSNGLRARTP